MSPVLFFELFIIHSILDLENTTTGSYMKSNISEDTLATDKTRESIIAAAEKLIRRHGPAKTKIVDVARHLGMSHANVYRHFENKAGIENVVAERWLENIIEPLNSILKGRGLASNRIRKWIFKLIEIKSDPSKTTRNYSRPTIRLRKAHGK